MEKEFSEEELVKINEEAKILYDKILNGKYEQKTNFSSQEEARFYNAILEKVIEMQEEDDEDEYEYNYDEYMGEITEEDIKRVCENSKNYVYTDDLSEEERKNMLIKKEIIQERNKEAEEFLNMTETERNADYNNKAIKAKKFAEEMGMTIYELTDDKEDE